jgi:hypothetical protein
MIVHKFEFNFFETEIIASDKLKETIDKAQFHLYKKENVLTTWGLQNQEFQEKAIEDLKPFLLDFGKQINQPKAVVQDVWCQKYSVDQHHGTHIHGVGAHEYSFIWYINCSEQSSNTVFFNPGFPYVNTDYVKIKPKQNKFILFPGYIPHEVEKNSDNERCIVSGNIKFYG